MIFWIIVFRKLPANGMALFPFILVKTKAQRSDQILINHEKIHLAQQLELLIIPFYIAYLFNYLFNLLRYKQHHLAYSQICFEREAYQNESNLSYLKQRKWLAMFRK